MKKRKKTVLFLAISLLVMLLLVLIAAALPLADRYNLIPHKYYTGADFGVQTLLSGYDFNGNEQDDYADLVLGARKDAENKPKYDGSYQPGGYPPEDIGVCTDVVWRAFREAGYSLKEMVSKDIAARPQAYGIEKSDPNIDFRRVPNLEIFFKKYGQSLTTDIAKIHEWQPGDIVVFGRGKHIGIVSDRRDKTGKPYIIHNGGQPVREENYFKRKPIPTGHYRFKPQSVPTGILTEWK